MSMMTYKIINFVQKTAMLVALLAAGFIVSNIMTATIAFALVAGLGLGLACMLNFPIEEHLDALKVAALIIALPSLYFLAGNLLAPLVVLAAAASVADVCRRLQGGLSLSPCGVCDSVPPPSAAPSASYSSQDNGVEHQVESLLACVTPMLYQVYYNAGNSGGGMNGHSFTRDTADTAEFTGAGYPILNK